MWLDNIKGSYQNFLPSHRTKIHFCSSEKPRRDPGVRFAIPSFNLKNAKLNRTNSVHIQLTFRKELKSNLLIANFQQVYDEELVRFVSCRCIVYNLMLLQYKLWLG